MNITETRSENFGTCYTLTTSQPASAHTFFRIPLTKSKNLKIFIHDPGDEFWIIRSFFPVNIDVITIQGKCRF